MSGDFDDLAREESAEFLPEPEETIKQDWRDDPGWRLVSYSYTAGLWSAAEAPNRPPAEAELANPPIWASLYDGSQVVATWHRPRAADGPSDHSATVVA